MYAMFYRSIFNNDISNWDVDNVIDMGFMFCSSEFNQDISNWDVNKVSNTDGIFVNCPIRDEYKPNIK